MTDQSASILVLNSGSSSLKSGLYVTGADDEQVLLHGTAEGIGTQSGRLEILDASGATLIMEERCLESQPDALGTLLKVLVKQKYPPLAGVGHRIVHGGPHLREHLHITPEVLQTLSDSVHFAPLHIPQAV